MWHNHLWVRSGSVLSHIYALSQFLPVTVAVWAGVHLFVRRLLLVTINPSRPWREKSSSSSCLHLLRYSVPQSWREGVARNSIWAPYVCRQRSSAPWFFFSPATWIRLVGWREGWPASNSLSPEHSDSSKGQPSNELAKTRARPKCTGLVSYIPAAVRIVRYQQILADRLWPQVEPMSPLLLLRHYYKYNNKARILFLLSTLILV